MDRRTFLRFLLATPLAATVDVEALIWVPKPIIVVPALQVGPVSSNMGALVVAAWEEYVGSEPIDEVFNLRYLSFD